MVSYMLSLQEGKRIAAKYSWEDHLQIGHVQKCCEACKQTVQWHVLLSASH